MTSGAVSVAFWFIFYVSRYDSEVTFRWRSVSVCWRSRSTGYRRVGDDQGDATLGGGVVLNPPKSKPVTFAEDDQILVLA